MNRRPLLLAALATGALTTGIGNSAPAASTNQPLVDKGNYAFFGAIPDRNIFNPNRVPHLTRANRGDASRGPSVDALMLVGTLSYEKGTFAFFTGPVPEYQKALRHGEEIAGFRISAIRPDVVLLIASNRTLELPVGRQLVRDADEGWQLAPESDAAAPDRPENQPPAVSSTAAAPPTAAPPVAPASAPPPEAAPLPSSDVLKRLMQRREQEQQ